MVFANVKREKKAKQMIAKEYCGLLKAVNMAKIQWQYARHHQDENCRKYDLLDIVERRYMFLLNVAKSRKLHALACRRMN